MSLIDYELQHHANLALVEKAEGSVVALAGDYPGGHSVPLHSHSRAQLLHPMTGVVAVSTQSGRWMVPPEHALWIPAGLPHAVEMLGDVSMRSLYVTPGAIPGLPEGTRVVGLTPLMRSLIVEAVKEPAATSERAKLVMALLLQEIPDLPELPLGLPLPAEPRLAALCKKFVAAPDPHETIDAWADRLAMSRRAFTRAFRRETGISLSMWRQQACLFAALPRLAGGEAVTSVALDLGYESVAAFTTMFKRMLGAPPKSYLRLSDTRG